MEAEMKHALSCHIFKNLGLWILFPFIFTFLLFGCSSNSILNSKLSITPEEQKRLVGAMERKSNSELYVSDLSDAVHPSEKELFKEADLVSSEAFIRNYKILVKWYENKLSKAELRYLANNCSVLLGGFAESFPVTETSLPCAGWWLERRAGTLAQKKNVKEMTKNRQSSSPQMVLSTKNLVKLPSYKKLTFSDATYNVDRLTKNQIDKLTKQATVNKKNCQYKNTYAALIFKLDGLSSQESTYRKIEKLYQHSLSCYSSDDPYAERLNLRVGILSVMHRNYQLAIHALQRNQSISEPQDNSRSLFWLGIAENKKRNGKQSLANEYWQQMIRENPLGFFSIIANEKLNQDPFDKFVSDQSISIQNRIAGGWNENNLQTFLADLFHKKHETQALKRLARNVANNYWVVDKDLFLYWANINNIAENDRSTILMMAKYFESQKEPKISARILELNFPTRYSDEILNTSNKIDPLLVLALIRQESAFDSNALSGADARGLMQVLPSTARTLQKGIKPEKLYEPKINIKLGVMYLEKLFQRYNGRTEYVLAAYNAGPTRVDTWSQRATSKTPLLFIEYVPFRETRNYVSTIMRNYYWYKRLMDGQKNDNLAKLYLEKNLASIWKPESIIKTFD